MRGFNAFLLTAAVLVVGACGSDSPPTCSLEGGTSLAVSPWPKFRADLSNTGRSSADLSGLGGNWQKVWRHQTGGVVSSSPAIGPEGEIYIGSADTKMYRLAGANGVVEWQGLTGSGIVTGPAIDLAGRVFTTSNDGFLYTFLASDGTAARGAVGIGGIPASPTVAGPANAGVIYVGSLTTGLLAVCPNNIFRWASQIVTVGAMPAVGASSTVYSTGANDARLALAIDALNGTTLWFFTATAPINASPVVADSGAVYIVDGKGRAFALDPTLGSSPGVFYDADAPVSASPALGLDGTLYIADLNGKVAAVDPSLPPSDPPNPPLWSVTVRDGAIVTDGVGSAINSSPAISADGTLIFGADDGWLYALREVDGEVELRWTFQTEGAIRSSPAIAPDGTVYFGSADRNVYAVRPE